MGFKSGMTVHLIWAQFAFQLWKNTNQYPNWDCWTLCSWNSSSSVVSSSGRPRTLETLRDDLGVYLKVSIIVLHMTSSAQSFPSHHAEKFFRKSFREFPCPAWAVASCSSFPQAEELPKTFSKNLSAWWDGKLCIDLGHPAPILFLDLAVIKTGFTSDEI